MPECRASGDPSGGRQIGGWEPQGDGAVGRTTPRRRKSGPVPEPYVDEARGARPGTERRRPAGLVQLKAAELSEDRSRFTLTFPPGVLDNLAESSDSK